MEKKIKVQDILTDTDFTCFIVPSLFSKSECEKLLSLEIKTSFQKAKYNYPTYYRNNDRLVKDDKDLASFLFQKVKPYLPKTISINSNMENENGLWNLKGLNHRIRFCKYSANQYFNRHLDGIHYEDRTTQSKLTFMVYLNNATEFEGGKTLFYKTKETNTIWASYKPRQGDLILFDHNIWHEGEKLISGEKFVLRSDILYSRKEFLTKEKTFTGHLGYIWTLLKMNNFILSGGRDKQIRIWNSEGQQLEVLKGHKSSILCIEKINDHIFISGSRDQQIIIWKDNKILDRIHIHSAVILSLCHLEKDVFISASGDNTIKISNISGTVLKTFSEHKNWVWKVIKLNKTIIASCSEDCSIKIWDITLKKPILTFKEKSPILSIAFNKTKNQLISGNLMGYISIRTLDDNYNQKNIEIFRAHSGIIRTIKFINDEFFATGGEDNKVKVWTMNGVKVSEIQHENFVQSIEALNQNTILSASYDGTIKTLCLKNETLL